MPPRPSHTQALANLPLLETLAPFDPHIAGTPPLGIDMPGSDIDILCHAPDAQAFAAHLWQKLSHHPHFTLRQWIGPDRPVIARFVAQGWEIEIFGQDRPVAQQQGWRHFRVEQRLLTLGGASFRTAILAARHAGAKTEPAFAQLLGLPGNPYAALLDLESHSDESLAALLRACGYPLSAAAPRSAPPPAPG